MRKKIIAAAIILAVIAFSYAEMNLITGRVTQQEIVNSYPELFEYNTERNTNLMIGIKSISEEFNENNIQVTPALLAAIVATLKKEVAVGAFRPVSEFATTTCRRYGGGCNYKGRGYIQLTHKSNYLTYCGQECLMGAGDYCYNLPTGSTNNENSISERDELRSYVEHCPPARAMLPEYASKAFVHYYINRDLVNLAEQGQYWTVGKRINGGDDYATVFNTIAHTELQKFQSSQEKTERLLNYLNSDLPSQPEPPDLPPEPDDPGDLDPAPQVPEQPETYVTFPDPDIPEDAQGAHSVYPGFKTDIEYDLREYEEIAEQAQELIQDVQNCKNLIGYPGEPVSVTECVRTRMPNNWEIAYAGTDRFCFNVESDFELPFFDGDKVEQKKVVYKFALRID